MSILASALKKAGYEVTNLDYPSTKYPIEVLAEDYLAPAIRQLQDGYNGSIHVVTHSLGGILIRQYCQNHDLPAGSRIVMLAPPNHGSEIVDHVKTHRWFQWLDGPAGQQLGTDAESLPNSLKTIHYDIGIIAGDRSMYPPLSWWLPKPNDGLVSVASTKLDEMKDFRLLHAGHMLIMNKRVVIEQTQHFFQHGSFR